jgi:hypothetical protein
MTAKGVETIQAAAHLQVRDEGHVRWRGADAPDELTQGVEAHLRQAAAAAAAAVACHVNINSKPSTPILTAPP